jgi:hypothetical protein
VTTPKNNNTLTNYYPKRILDLDRKLNNNYSNLKAKTQNCDNFFKFNNIKKLDIRSSLADPKYKKDKKIRLVT